MMTAAFLVGLAVQDLKTHWKESYSKGAEFLIQSQGSEGLWTKEFRGQQFPTLAYTVLSVDALVRMPASLKEKHKSAIDKGIGVIEKMQDEKEGSWAEPPGQLKAYVTSLAIMALHAHDPVRHKTRIERGQKYLAALQVTEGFGIGGSGYGEKELHAGKLDQSTINNMGTTGQIATALHETGYDNKEYWQRLVKFLEGCQNFSENKNVDPEWLKLLSSKGFKMGNDGSFIYKQDPESAPKYAGETVNPDGTKTINGYGSMTYEGLESYLYAGLTRDDPRVRAAVDWIRKNYSVDRHPGFPFEKDMPGAKRKDQQGMFFYYSAMTRSLDAYGENPFTTEDGRRRAWPEDLAKKLVSLQKPDGSWINEQVRWWEADKQLCTPYVLKIYSILAKYLDGA